MTAVGKLRDMVESEEDAKTALLRELGDLSEERVLHGKVLCAIHPGTKYHPGTTLLRSDQSLLESQYQGNTFLVLKMGPSAFKDEPKLGIFHLDKPKVGDWVQAVPSDGRQQFIRKVPCRVFDDLSIQMVVSDPEMYW